MVEYKQIMVEPEEVANVLNALGHDGCSINYIIPCHEYDGTLILIVYKEFKE